MLAALTFLSPPAGLLALAAVVPLWVSLCSERRARQVAARLSLPEPPPRARRPLLAALCAVPALLALAAAQPVVDRTTTREGRDDAEAFFVFDISRSMLAASGADAPTRLERAKQAALRLRSALGDVPVGIASITDRTLPHLFPTLDEEVFSRTLERAVGIQRPPPGAATTGRVTTLAALSTTASQNFFTHSARYRLLVVFSDDESVPFLEARVGTIFRRPPGVRTIFLHVWRPGERIYSAAGLPEVGYRPDPTSETTAAQLAAATGGRAFSERELAAASRAARTSLGEGALVRRREERAKLPLAPYVTLAAFLPLGFLLRRRNL